MAVIDDESLEKGLLRAAWCCDIRGRESEPAIACARVPHGVKAKMRSSQR